MDCDGHSISDEGMTKMRNYLDRTIRHFDADFFYYRVIGKVKLAHEISVGETLPDGSAPSLYHILQDTGKKQSGLKFHIHAKSLSKFFFL